MPEAVYDTGPATNAEFDTTALRFTYTSLVTPEHGLRRGPRHRRAHASSRRTEVLGGHDPARLRDRPALGHRARRHAGADLLRAPARTSPLDGTAPVPALRLRLLRGVHRPRLLEPAPLAARPRLRVRHRPRAGRRRDGPALVRRRQAAAQAQHLHRLHRRGRAPRGRGLHRRRTASWPAAARPAACSWARSPTCGPTCSRRSWPRCRSSTASRRSSTRRCPLTVTEWEEWGNPVDGPRGVRLHEGLQPVRQRRRRSRTRRSSPPAGLNDPRVSYWEPAKWVQALRAATTSDRPVYLKTEMGAGPPGPVGPLRRVEGRGVRLRLRARHAQSSLTMVPRAGAVGDGHARPGC